MLRTNQIGLPPSSPRKNLFDPSRVLENAKNERGVSPSDAYRYLDSVKQDYPYKDDSKGEGLRHLMGAALNLGQELPKAFGAAALIIKKAPPSYLQGFTPEVRTTLIAYFQSMKSKDKEGPEIWTGAIKQLRCAQRPQGSGTLLSERKILVENPQNRQMGTSSAPGGAESAVVTFIVNAMSEDHKAFLKTVGEALENNQFTKISSEEACNFLCSLTPYEDVRDIKGSTLLALIQATLSYFSASRVRESLDALTVLTPQLSQECLNLLNENLDTLSHAIWKNKNLTNNGSASISNKLVDLNASIKNQIRIWNQTLQKDQNG